MNLKDALQFLWWIPQTTFKKDLKRNLIIIISATLKMLMILNLALNNLQFKHLI